MPYKSQKQEDYLRINKPGVAKVFDSHKRKKKKRDYLMEKAHG